MNNLIFLSFYLIFYFSGIGINKLFSRKANDDLDILNNSKFLLHDLYPLLSLFVLGNLNLVINFFLPLNKIVVPVLLVIFSLFIFGLIESIKSKLKNVNLLNQVFIPLIVSLVPME